ncbi:MAG: DUF4091 domain-containing protein [Eubacteriales bacterium]|nr:DUF4091 domain-containing protein [Eubacteriales bacterium]
MKLNTCVLSPVVKVLPGDHPTQMGNSFSGMRNETISFQIALWVTDETGRARPSLHWQIDSPAAEYLHVRKVKNIPVRYGKMQPADDYYINNAVPGLYPDVLSEIPVNGFRMLDGITQTLWFDLEPDGKLSAGDYPVAIRFFDEADELLAQTEVQLHIVDAMLPKQTLMHTRWFHSDCLATYYGAEIFSPQYWEIVERYIACAVRRGINMILLPIHTPPLDTNIGKYRPTVQLVEVTYKDGKYSFGFERLHRWVEMCKRCGVEYYEAAHLFTQWGAGFAPQIIAQTEQGEKRIFGWDTPAVGGAYEEFLGEYLPAVVSELKKLGIAERVYFHISDEPNAAQLEGYLAAKKIAAKHLSGFKIMDALSDIAYFRSGAVEYPVPATNHIEPFLAENVPEKWGYYACTQGTDVSNVFVTMPGERTRILGVQMYKAALDGFLQWGFNFYYARRSDYPINPWFDTDCDGFAPAGDAFVVYPGADGAPVESIRLMLLHHAVQDMRALQLLESLRGREYALSVVDEGIAPITFSSYPHGSEYLPDLRERVNREIEKAAEEKRA